MNRHMVSAAFIVASLLVVSASAVASSSIAAAFARADEFSGQQPSSWYLRASGMLVDQQDAGLRDRTPGGSIEAALVGAGLPSSGWDLQSDTGFGLTLAAGYRLEDSPLSFELEYSYRSADFTSIVAGDLAASAVGDGQTHALMFNVIGDWALGNSPVGVYAGLGAGIADTRVELRSVDGVDTLLDSDSDTTFAWQAMAGLTVSLGSRSQLYGGIRYFDAGDVDFEALGGENASFNYEVGIRFFF